MKELLPLMIIHFLWPFVTGLLAKHAGRNFWIWFLIGALLPCLGLLILFLLPRKTKATVESEVASKDKNYLPVSA